MKIFYLYTADWKKVFVKVDDADAYLMRSMNWRISKSREGVPSVVRYIAGNGKQYLARYLLGIDDENIIVVHKNGDQLDCRRVNLCTVSRGEQFARIRKLRFSSAASAFGLFSCGHPRAPENTYAGNGNSRGSCRICGINRAKAQYQRTKKEIEALHDVDEV